MSLDQVAQLDEAGFARVRELVYQHAGIALGDNKRQLCQTRLVRRLRALDLTDFDSYLALLEDPTSDEHGQLVNAITTNVTAFFREPHHFTWLAGHLSRLARDERRQRLRVWSAGCSSGEEAWSLAMVVDEGHLPARWDVKILASDIDTQILAAAEEGVYSEQRVEAVSERRRKCYFLRGRGDQRGQWRVGQRLRELVRFRRLNLFDAWPMQQPFDLIVCRNVMIYFDHDARSRLVGRYARALAPGGHLVLGHSESLMHEGHGLVPVEKTIYRRGP